MTISVDTFAATNPAFCSAILCSFAEGFASTNSNGIPFPFILLPIPFVLTSDLATSFEGTNVTTGLLSWLVKRPEVTVDIRERILKTAEYSKQALLFGARYGAFVVAEDGHVFLAPSALAKKLPVTGRASVITPLKLAKRLGTWVGEAGTTETILIALGVNR